MRKDQNFCETKLTRQPQVYGTVVVGVSQKKIFYNILHDLFSQYLKMLEIKSPIISFQMSFKPTPIETHTSLMKSRPGALLIT